MSRAKVNSIDDMGKYRHLKRYKLEDAKKRYLNQKQLETIDIDINQEKYLLEIYKLASDKGINFILLNTPTHPILNTGYHDEYKNHYYALAKKMPKATLINHSDIYIPEYGFSDLDHLNDKGAKLYSEYLIEASSLKMKTYQHK